MTRTFIVLTIAATLCMASVSQAATLAQYDINGANDVSPDVFDAGLTASNLTNILGVGGATDNGGWLFNGTNFAGQGTGGGNLVATNAAHRIFSFSLSADPGSALLLDSIDWTVGIKRTRNANNGYHYSLVYVSDQSDFSNILAQSGNLGQNAATAPHATEVPLQTYATESFTFGDLDVSPYETLYFAVESSTNFTSVDIDPIYFDFTVNGSVVPEPSTWVLLGFGAIGLATLGIRRRLARA